jgi:hypothetical protein
MVRGMQLQERVRSARDDAKIRMRDARLEKVDRDRGRLKTENEILKARLEGTTEERARWMEAIDELTSRPEVTVKTKKHRLRRLFVLGAAAGSAYVVGAKAGRERYEQLRSWFAGMRNRGDDASWASDSARMTSMSSGATPSSPPTSSPGSSSSGAGTSSTSSMGGGSTGGSSTPPSTSGGSSPTGSTSKDSGSSAGSSSKKGSTPA